MKKCPGCDKQMDDYVNFCSWDCHVELAKRDGATKHCPNGLPVKCITRDNLMIEHEHGDHPDYKFPVEVNFVGLITPDDCYDYELLTGNKYEGENDLQAVRRFKSEIHALIYVDGSIALTMYECCYKIFSLRDGMNISGASSGWKRGEYILSDESLKKARELKK